MEQVSVTLKATFVIITLLTVFQFYRAANRSNPALVMILVWMAFLLVTGQTDMYTDGFAKPPKFILLVAPPMLLILTLFITTGGRNFIDNLNAGQLTLLHTIRIGVEIVLFYLFMAKTIPIEMTFEGRNFDIIAGLTAPLVYYFGYVKKLLSSRLLIAWNICCLALLMNIVITAIFSVHTPFQHFGFDQPNIAVAHFPFCWLPGVVVPLVLFSHLATLRQLLLNRDH